jgi:RHS repeat-associated protein
MGILRLSSVLICVSLLAPCAFAKGPDPEEKIEYYLTDHLGGVEAVMDEQGNVVERRDYLPFGEERVRVSSAKKAEDHGFTGKELDAESGLYYYGARYYDPELGRFTAVDPLVLSESSRPLGSVLANPQELNGYAYVVNNPLKYIDPTGMFNVKTGAVEKGDTLSAITKTVNQINKTSYSVSDMAKLNSITNPDSIKEGQILMPNEVIKDVTNELNGEMKKWGDILKKYANCMMVEKFPIIYDYASSSEKMNLKNRHGSVFNTKENKGNEYIFEAEKIRSDAPANILYGYASKSINISDFWSFAGAGIFQQYKGTSKSEWGNGWPNYGDDPVDNLYIRKGMAIYDQKNHS